VGADPYVTVSVGLNIAGTSVYVPALYTVLAIEELIVKVPGNSVPPSDVNADPPERDTLPIVAGYVMVAETVGREEI
jgi:hypothetical protein